MAQLAASQEIAAQRAAAIASRVVEGARRSPSDEMRGGLHAMGETRRSNRLTCPVIACPWGAETDEAMEAHVKACHPEIAFPGGVAAHQALFDHQRRHGNGALGEYGRAQMARATEKMFSRAEILAILGAQRALVAGTVVDAEYQRLIMIFTSME